MIEKGRNPWVKYRDTLGERQKWVLREIRKAPATIHELAGRMKWPVGLVASCVCELIEKGRVRRDGHAVTTSETKKSVTAKPGDDPGLAWGQPL